MAETLPGNSFVIRQSTAFLRTFFFGTTGQTVVVNISKNGGAFAAAAGSPATEIPAGGTGPGGWYTVSLTNVDTSVAGILAYHCTAGAGGPADFSDMVQANFFTMSGVADLLTDGTGRVFITSNIKQNIPLNGFAFVMTSNVTHAPLPGLGTGVTAQRSLGGAGFAPCANTPTELSNGVYVINLAATDMNAATVLLRFTNASADDLDILLTTQP